MRRSPTISNASAKSAPVAAIDPELQRFSKFRQEHRSFVTLAFGHAGKPKILGYSLDSLIRSGALHTAFQTAGTVFSMNSTLVKSQLSYLLISAVTFCGAWFWFDAADAYEANQAPSQALEHIAFYLNVFIPFILGLYISLCLTRWWAVREQGIGKVLDASVNIALLMSAMFPEPEWADLHEQILRWCMASVSLIVSACRGKQEISILGSGGDSLVTDEELEILEGMPFRARAVLLWTWILMLVSKLCDQMSIPDGKFRDIATECLSARNGISLIWTSISTQLPFAYVHLVTVLVHVNCLVTAVKCGLLMAISIRSEVWSEVINQMLFMFVVPPLYQGLLGISHVIHDPFGEDILDFPIMAFQEYCHESAYAIASSGHRCPALHKEVPRLEDLLSAEEKLPLKEFAQPAEPEVAAPSNLSTVLNDSVQRMERALGQLKADREEFINVLQQDVHVLEGSAAAVRRKIDILEQRVQQAAVEKDSSPHAVLESTFGWCRSPEAARPEAIRMQ